MREGPERRTATGASGGQRLSKPERPAPWWGWKRSVWTERMLTRLTEGGPANRVCSD